MRRKISIEGVNGLSEEEFVALFGSLYEHAPWVAEAAWQARPFASLPDLRRELHGIVRGAPEERQIGLLHNYPDLAGKAAVAGELSPESTREHAAAGLDTLTPGEYETLNRLNAAYRRKFDVPLIFAVREHTKQTILSGAEARLGHSQTEEIEFALGEISKIADLRLQDLVEGGR